MSFLKRDRGDHPLADLHRYTPASVSERVEVLSEPEELDGETEDDVSDASWDTEITRRMGLSSAELYRDAAEDQINGDLAAGLFEDGDGNLEPTGDVYTDDDSFREATIYYMRANISAKLADIRARQGQ